jgi:uncharacterized protein (TIGR03435 family)
MVRAAAGLLIVISAYGQSPSAPQFEVASVRPSPPGNVNGGSGGHSGKGRLAMNNVTLKRCIIGAYGIGPNEIAGGPDWLDTDHFDIAAKAEKPVGDSELMLMLRELLSQRFKLTLHRETRSSRVYVMELGKNGPKLVKSAAGESSTLNGRGSIVAKATTMKSFASILSRQMDYPVVNQTGLDGSFDLKLEWTPESTSTGGPNRDSTDRGPSIFTAIQEQLGLRLRSEKAPVEVLVIDHAEKPTEN